MSLYIGNLSEQTRRDELERVFRRFGHCNVQLKREGYGFVVFDNPTDAAKALRSLKGRNICGEPLTLSWSNKQPRNFQRFDRGDRNFELQRARNSDRLGYARRKADFNRWRNYKMGNVGRGQSVDMPGKEGEYNQDDYKDFVVEEKDYGEDFPDDGGGVIPNMEDSGRWGESIHDPSNNSGNENAKDFDRYEPYHGYDRKQDNEDHHIGYSGSSPAANSQENMGRAKVEKETPNQPNDSKYQQTCYVCGDSGHKMRNCPEKHSLRRKYNRWDDRLEDKIDRKCRDEDKSKFGSGSLLKLRSSGDTISMRHNTNEHKVSGSQHYHTPLRNESSFLEMETDRLQRKEYGGKKRSRNEIGSPKRSGVKISRRSISSSLVSDYYSSRSLSRSQSSKSVPRSRCRSRSRSVPSRAHSPSSKSRSSSKSQYRRGRSLNTRRSSSPTSLSVSPSHPLPSSQNKINLNLNATALESANHFVAQEQQIGNTKALENDQSHTAIAMNGNAAVYTTVVDAMKKNQYIQEDNDENNILSQSDRVTNTSLVAGNLSPGIMNEIEGFQHSGTPMMGNIPSENEKPHLDTHSNPHSGLSTFISAEEVCVVLKHYGLELPKDVEKNLTMDAFFGSARLWPWHIIYYRRLKKGPISTENYARRVAQNQEYGIVDKYIRSSSGWGESSFGNSNTAAANDTTLVDISS